MRWGELWWIVVAAMLLSSAGTAAEEAMVLYKSGKGGSVNVVGLDGSVTLLGTPEFRERQGSILMEMPDSRFGMLWLAQSGRMGITLGRNATTDVQQTFPEYSYWDGTKVSFHMKDLALDPQARRLAYIDQSKGQSLCVKDLSGAGGPRALLESDQWLQAPSWSPDGSRIAVYQAKEGGKPCLYRLLVVDAQTGQAREVAPPCKETFGFADGSIRPAAWRPNGRAIFFESYYEEKEPGWDAFIYAVSPDGGRVVRIGAGYEPQVHPDGDRLYYQAASEGASEGGLAVYNLEDDTQVLVEGTRLFKISPSGKYLACLRPRGKDEPPRRPGTTITLTDKDGQIVKTIETGQSLGRVVGWVEE